MNGNGKVSTAPKTCVVQSKVKSRSLFEVNFVSFGHFTVSLPLISLIVCFVSAVLFQYDQVNKTDTCVHVPNMVPSISAITGVTPQRYIWRLCIALHSAPRFAIGFIYWNYYRQRVQFVSSEYLNLHRRLATFILCVYIVENACLCGVTFIANVENYPVHEKIFIVFMIMSILHELLTIIMFRWSHPNMTSMPHISSSFKYKCACFAAISACTCGLLYFYFRHRWYCEPGAFTMFSTFEYGIAIANIIFHWTAVYEFKDLKWSIFQSSDPAPTALVEGDNSSAFTSSYPNNHPKQH